ncbi:hypothetical protein RM704_35990 [Streptomyces sp. DSM 3412]|uniref:Uncharacterized protein n=1 Tax=Streptomyces gottesmaniae TaxID=3075518 RepID=A0ABU2ZB40_9ACTN|nr:hypothetical protein [Streptomyces sp. DSM 3412]MDT0572804.1 hypothetical protein [Streptomyces sp. DSM 3412]
MKIPDRSLVPRVHAVCAGRRDEAVDEHAVEHTDALEERQRMTLLRSWVERSEDQVIELREELRNAHRGRDDLTLRANGLGHDVRALQGSTDLIRALIAEQSARERTPCSRLTVPWSSRLIAACALTGVLGLFVAFVGTALFGDSAPWRIHLWQTVGAATVIALLARWSRARALTAARSRWGDHQHRLDRALPGRSGLRRSPLGVRHGPAQPGGSCGNRSEVTAAISDCRSPSSLDESGDHMPVHLDDRRAHLSRAP